jgi:hypothetical protein
VPTLPFKKEILSIPFALLKAVPVILSTNLCVLAPWREKKYQEKWWAQPTLRFNSWQFVLKYFLWYKTTPKLADSLGGATRRMPTSEDVRGHGTRPPESW